MKTIGRFLSKHMTTLGAFLLLALGFVVSAHAGVHHDPLLGMVAIGAVTNKASTFSNDVQLWIQKEVLRLARRDLVAYQFGKKLTLPKQQGTTYQATRYERVPLPFQSLSEGVAPAGEAMTITPVTATAVQWGDSITLTDVAEMTIFHDPFKQAIRLTGLQIAETQERNTMNNLMGGTNVNYAGAVGSRASLTTGNVLTFHEVNRSVGALNTNGAPRFTGDDEDNQLDAYEGTGGNQPNNRLTLPHYIGLMHTLVTQDLREDTTVQTAWSRSDVEKIYQMEVGELNGVRFCSSNLIPSFTGVSSVSITTSTTGGTMVTGTYTVQVTGSDTSLNYESRIYQVSAPVITGTTGSMSLTTPNTAGFTYSVYVSNGAPTVPANLGLSTSGPTTGPLAGQAVQLPPNTAVVITGVGAAQTPPAAPATGQTVYPTFFFGMEAYGIVSLDEVKTYYLKDADKSDPANQLRVVAWKQMYGTIILNNTFFCRTESVSAFKSTYG